MGTFVQKMREQLKMKEESLLRKDQEIQKKD